MSDDERYGTRDLTYSRWHRYAMSRDAAMIDLDDVEYCRRCRMPLALIEVGRDVGQEYKNSAVTREIARLLNVPALVVLYTPSGVDCSCTRRAGIVPDCDHGIASMRWCRIFPTYTPFVVVDARDFAASLERLHDGHQVVHRLGESA